MATMVWQYELGRHVIVKLAEVEFMQIIHFLKGTKQCYD